MERIWLKDYPPGVPAEITKVPAALEPHVGVVRGTVDSGAVR